MKTRDAAELARLLTNKLNDLHSVLNGIQTDMRGLIALITGVVGERNDGVGSVHRDLVALHALIREELGTVRRIAEARAEADGIEAPDDDEEDDDDDDDQSENRHTASNVRAQETLDTKKVRCAIQLIALCTYRSTFVEIDKTPAVVIDKLKIYANDLAKCITLDGDR